MKIKISSIIKTLTFLCATAACVFVSALVLRDKDSEYKYADFFDMAEKNQIDVLFIGSSHVINAINPAVLFNEYGITSYNMGGHGSVMQSTYWELKEALQYCTPKCVVVDTYMLEKDYKYLDEMYEDSDDGERASSIAQLHLNMDCWPLNELKVQAVQDLIKDKDIQKQFLVDYYVYHNRWENLSRSDYTALVGEQERNRLFGAEMRYDIELASRHNDEVSHERLEEETVGTRYLRKVIEECKNRGIDVIVTYYPCSAEDIDRRAANTASDIAEEYGAPCVNMLREEVIDYSTDLNDTGHLNAIGAIKVTRYLGDMLCGIFELTDHRGDQAYGEWEKRCTSYSEAFTDLAVSSESIYKQLNYLTVTDVSSIVYINDESEAFEDDEIRKLISNLSGTGKIWKTKGPYILIDDRKSGKVSEAMGNRDLHGVESAIGTLNYRPVEHLFRLLYTDEDPYTNYLYDDSMNEFDIQIIIYDSESGEILSHSYYRSYGCNYTRG